jgi:hypothetical protein
MSAFFPFSIEPYLQSKPKAVAQLSVDICRIAGIENQFYDKSSCSEIIALPPFVQPVPILSFIPVSNNCFA